MLIRYQKNFYVVGPDGEIAVGQLMKIKDVVTKTVDISGFIS